MRQCSLQADEIDSALAVLDQLVISNTSGAMTAARYYTHAGRTVAVRTGNTNAGLYSNNNLTTFSDPTGFAHCAHPCGAKPATGTGGSIIATPMKPGSSGKKGPGKGGKSRDIKTNTMPTTTSNNHGSPGPIFIFPPSGFNPIRWVWRRFRSSGPRRVADHRGYAHHVGHSGLIPGVGDLADAINAAWYLLEGDYVNAGISGMGMIPGIGAGVTGIRVGMKAPKILPKLQNSYRDMGGIPPIPWRTKVDKAREKLPSNWGAGGSNRKSDKPGRKPKPGWRWKGPDNPKSNMVRMDEGDPTNPNKESTS